MKAENLYTQDIASCFEIKNGFDRGVFESYLEQLKPTVADIRKKHEEKSFPHYVLPERMDDIDTFKDIAARFSRDFDHIIVLGTGGSSSGGQALCNLRYLNVNPKMTFIDNVSVGSFEVLLNTIDFAKTGFIVISKSGSTAEPLAKFLVILEKLIEQNATENTIVITEEKESALYQLANEHNIQVMAHDPHLGGRFSVLSLVGLLPSMIAGLNVHAVREGANIVLQQTLEEGQNAPPALGAAISIQAAVEHKLPMQIFMPYIERLRLFSTWYRQLWAESLGKNGKGTTPVDALGPVDQHSQLQLYLGGPRDKFFTLFIEDVVRKGPTIRSDLAASVGLDYLENKTIGDLLAAQQKATVETLINNQRPVRLFKVPELNEKTLGALLMHFMLETIFAASLLDVDAFDQPAVEQGKILTKNYLKDGEDLRLDAA